MNKQKIKECILEAKAHLGNVTCYDERDDEISEAYIYLNEALDLLEENK